MGRNLHRRFSSDVIGNGILSGVAGSTTPVPDPEWDNPENFIFNTPESAPSGWDNPENFLFDITKVALKPTYTTENVIVLIMDGPRYTETWGEPTRQYIPNMVAMAPSGVVCEEFYNDGYTFTINGHIAITTGVEQSIANDGGQLPDSAGIFQLYRKKTGLPQSKISLVTSKDKLEILSNTTDPAFNNLYLPTTDCGTAGNPSAYRADSITYANALAVLQNDKPNVMLVNFQQPDTAGHSGVWQDYLNGIVATDQYIKNLWDFIQTDPNYAGKTTVFVTNDHGRHDDSNGGFQGHGDGCDGCRHLNFFASGPDFKTNHISTIRRTQVDISKTIGQLLDMDVPDSTGNIMTELFK